MPAIKCNWLVLFKGESQVYSTATKSIALATPPPDGIPLEDKRVLFVTYQPDNEILSVHPLPQEEILQAEIAEKKTKKNDSTSIDDDEQ